MKLLFFFFSIVYHDMMEIWSYFRDEIIAILLTRFRKGKKEKRKKCDSMWPVTWQVSAINYKL